MSSRVKTVVNNAQAFSDAIRKLASTRVMVGYPAEKADRKPEDGEDSEMTNAQLGYIHENGAPEANIPARPHLGPGVKEVKSKIAEYLGVAGKKAFAGDEKGMMKAFNAAGLTAQNSVRAKITSGPFVALAGSTLRARKRRGRSGEKPLIDTGQMRQAVSYVVRLFKKPDLPPTE